MNEEKRDAIMAAVRQYGMSRLDQGGTTDANRWGKYGDEAKEHLAAIRDMLTPDDAVVIPRALAERAAGSVEIVAHAYKGHKVGESAKFDAEALRAVLRGEATRDE